MASMVVGGLFNAVAFAGAGFLFSKLNHSGYQDEIKRHNLALEELSRAKQKWYEKEVARKNDIELKRHQLIEANVDIKTTNKALAQLSVALATAEQEPKPTLNNFYTPSKEMKEYQALTMVVTGLGAGFLGHRIYKWYTTKSQDTTKSQGTTK